jgi:hypothetical protein
MRNRSEQFFSLAIKTSATSLCIPRPMLASSSSRFLTQAPDVRKQAILRELATLANQSLENALVILEIARVRVRR